MLVQCIASWAEAVQCMLCNVG